MKVFKLPLVLAMLTCTVPLASPVSAEALQVASKQALSKTVHVSGKVHYLERIGIIPGARLTIKISDTSIADAPEKVIVRKRVKFKRVPQAFAVSLPRSRFKNGMLTFSARVEGPNGELLWITDTHISVTPDPFSAYVDLGEILLKSTR